MIHILREKIKNKQVTLGQEETLKKLRQGLLKHVFITNNAAPEIVHKIKNYAADNVTVEELDFDNRELGVKSKKPFQIAIIGVLA